MPRPSRTAATTTAASPTASPAASTIPTTTASAVVTAAALLCTGAVVLAGPAAASGASPHASTATYRATSTAYRISSIVNTATEQRQVVRWNPCLVIHYRVNARLGGRQALADVQSAVAQLSRASGLHLAYDGPTGSVPTRGTPQAAPLVIAWAPASSTSYLARGDTGFGGWTASWDASTPAHITSGYVVVRAGSRLTAGFGPGVSRGRVLLHELGHAVGLEHVDDPTQEMTGAPVTPSSPAAGYRAGDIAGLHRVGAAAGCL